jgi:hypothetical protein
MYPPKVMNRLLAELYADPASSTGGGNVPLGLSGIHVCPNATKVTSVAPAAQLTIRLTIILLSAAI